MKSQKKFPQIHTYHIYMIAGVCFGILSILCHQFSYRILGWEIKEVTDAVRNLTIPCAGVGALVFLYGLVGFNRARGRKK